MRKKKARLIRFIHISVTKFGKRNMNTCLFWKKNSLNTLLFSDQFSLYFGFLLWFYYYFYILVFLYNFSHKSLFLFNNVRKTLKIFPFNLFSCMCFLLRMLELPRRKVWLRTHPGQTSLEEKTLPYKVVSTLVVPDPRLVVFMTPIWWTINYFIILLNSVIFIHLSHILVNGKSPFYILLKKKVQF